MLLLNPGPVTLSARVRASQLQPDLCHRESEFFDLQDEARRRLLSVYALDPALFTVGLITGSGTAAVESMIASLVPADGKLLIVQNGVYGDRIAQIAATYGIDHVVAMNDWMTAPDLDAVATMLDADRAIGHVAVVHHETTTGRLNDLVALADVCRSRGAKLLVDAVSSFGAEAIAFDDPTVVAVAGTANKCLHGVPGVAFVVVRRDALREATRRTFYLDLARLVQLQDQRNTPFTPSVHAHYALVEALREFDDEGGLAARHARYARLSTRVREGFLALGIDSVLPVDASSVVLRSFALPTGVDYRMLHDHLKPRGFVIYAGQGNLSATLFRISTMGAVEAADIDRLIDGVRMLATRVRTTDARSAG